MTHKKRTLNWIKYFLLATIFVSTSIATAASAQKDPLRSGERIFPDVYESYGYSDAIKYLSDKKIMNPYDDQEFKPSKPVTKAEFVTIVMKALDFGGQGKNCFKDVHKEWFAPYICEAQSRGFISPPLNGLFRPNDKIKFTQAAMILGNVFNLEKDSRLAETQYQPFVVALEKMNAIPLSITDFHVVMKRGTTAEIVWRLATKTTSRNTMTYDRIHAHERAVLFVDKNFKSKKAGFNEAFELMSEVEAQSLIEEIGLTLEPSEIANGLPDGVTEETIKEIKALAILSAPVYMKYLGEKVIKDKMIFMRSYKNLMYIVIPFKSTYFVYPTLDSATATFLSRDGEKSNFDSKMDDTWFIADKQYIYNINENFSLDLLDEVDTASFKKVYFDKNSRTAVFSDRNHVYHVRDRELYRIDEADPDSFVNRGGGIFTDENNVFFLNGLGQFTSVTGADPQTFAIAGSTPEKSYYRDSQNAYYLSLIDRTSRNTGANNIFAIMGIENLNLNEIGVVWGTIYKKNNELYYFTKTGEEPIKMGGVNVNSFREIPGSDHTLFTDGEGIFYYDTGTLALSKIEGAAYDGFKLMKFRKAKLPKNTKIIFRTKNAVFAFDPEQVRFKRLEKK